MMKIHKLFENWDLKKLSINAGFLDLEWEPGTQDQDAAWEIYVELITRVTTRNLSPEDGDNDAALASVYSLFPTTRDIIKKYGRAAINTSKIAIIVLNQMLRPFLTKWHPISKAGKLNEDENSKAFRDELETLRIQMVNYALTLATIAKVEDLASVEKN